MRRTLVSLALALALAAPAAQIATADGPAILVTAAGALDAPVTFAGTGFTPAAGLRQSLVHPDGTVYTVQKDGVEQVWVVGDDGTFTVNLVPATDFPNLAAGGWYTRFCTEDGASCWEATLTITMPAPPAPAILVTVGGALDAPVTFAGSGFTPAAGLRQFLVHPDGTVYTVQKDGVEQVWVVGADGSFTVDLVPATDFPNLAAGAWYTRFCTEDGASCWEATLTITM